MKRLRLAIAGSSSLLSFIASILALSEYLGGGLFGVAVSLVLSGTVGTLIHQTLRSSAEESARDSRVRDSNDAVCLHGPHGVVPGDITKLHLNVSKGDVVTGHLVELESYDFSWQILDERNLVRFLNGSKPRFVRGEYDVPASKVNWTVPHEGPWFLVLSVPGKQLPREVVVELRHI